MANVKNIAQAKITYAELCRGVAFTGIFAIMQILCSPAQRIRESACTGFCCHSKGREFMRPKMSFGP